MHILLAIGSFLDMARASFADITEAIYALAEAYRNGASSHVQWECFAMKIFHFFIIALWSLGMPPDLRKITYVFFKISFFKVWKGWWLCIYFSQTHIISSDRDDWKPSHRISSLKVALRSLFRGYSPDAFKFCLILAQHLVLWMAIKSLSLMWCVALQDLWKQLQRFIALSLIVYCELVWEPKLASVTSANKLLLVISLFAPCCWKQTTCSWRTKQACT